MTNRISFCQNQGKGGSDLWGPARMRKKEYRVKRFLAYAVLVSTASFVLAEPQKKGVQLSFDTLFPETAAKQLYDTMLQLWSDVTLLHNESLSERAKQDIADLVSGQVVRIKYLIEHMQTKNNTLNHEDIRYLQSIAHGLSRCYDTFFEQVHIQPLWAIINEGFASLACD